MRNEVTIRLGFFFGVLALMAIWELLVPRRALTISKTARWFANLAIISLNAAVVRTSLKTAEMGQVFEQPVRCPENEPRKRDRQYTIRIGL